MDCDLVAIEASVARIGSDRHYPEERPARLVETPGFRIARRPVSNADFADFAAATGYVTAAEALVTGGSICFTQPLGPVALNDPRGWWRHDREACWRAPEGAGSTIEGRMSHPVVHVSLRDAEAYAAWAGLRLPTEIEWEVAARGGLADAEFAWGEELLPQGRPPANFWTGSFPWHYSRGGRPGPSAPGQYPPNLFGLFDMIGNVWEWTSSPFDRRSTRCCSGTATENEARLWTLKGGSYLCAAEYCARYRPAARMGLAALSAAGHIGFRCAADG
ncbi:MAG: formylglycine-generating enzyme family protein [Alphaproteobacteria bacterium]|nr:formylglycine-generating enzyme family protein [Alphaproteobacteria bacterium]